MPSYQQLATPFVHIIEDQWFGKIVTPTIPTTWYVCMFTTTPGIADSGGVELTIGTGGYLRLAITNSSAFFAGAAARTKTCAGASFPLTWFTCTAPSGLGPIVATGLRDSPTAGAGTLYLINDIPTGSQQTIANGNNITFNAADFSFIIN